MNPINQSQQKPAEMGLMGLSWKDYVETILCDGVDELPVLHRRPTRFLRNVYQQKHCHSLDGKVQRWEEMKNDSWWQTHGCRNQNGSPWVPTIEQWANKDYFQALESNRTCLSGFQICLKQWPIYPFHFLPFRMGIFILCLSHRSILESDNLFSSFTNPQRERNFALRWIILTYTWFTCWDLKLFKLIFRWELGFKVNTVMS